MHKPGPSFTRNSLLSALSAGDYALLQPHFVRVSLAKGETVVTPNTPIDVIHFPETALLSVVAISPEGHRVEASVIGCDGMSGVPVALGADHCPQQVVVQMEGDALCIASDAFCTAMGESPSLRRVMLRYAQALFIQVSYTALSNTEHTVEERLARWLLMCHDRVETDEIVLTHDFLALMLAVRRPSVTTSLQILEGLGLLRATRGRIVIRDRAGLEDLARDAYGVPEAEYVRLIGSMPKAKELAASAAVHSATHQSVDAFKPDPEK